MYAQGVRWRGALISVTYRRLHDEQDMIDFDQSLDDGACDACILRQLGFALDVTIGILKFEIPVDELTFTKTLCVITQTRMQYYMQSQAHVDVFAEAVRKEGMGWLRSLVNSRSSKPYAPYPCVAYV
jgi:hypothetical protein